jgi:hypothetical protein
LPEFTIENWGTFKFPLSLQTVYDVIRLEAAIKVAEERMRRAHERFPDFLYLPHYQSHPGATLSVVVP